MQTLLPRRPTCKAGSRSAASIGCALIDSMERYSKNVAPDSWKYESGENLCAPL